MPVAYVARLKFRPPRIRQADQEVVAPRPGQPRLPDRERMPEAERAVAMIEGSHRQQLDGPGILDGHGDDELKPPAVVLGGRPRADRRIRPQPRLFTGIDPQGPEVRVLLPDRASLPGERLNHLSQEVLPHMLGEGTAGVVAWREVGHSHSLRPDRTFMVLAPVAYTLNLTPQRSVTNKHHGQFRTGPERKQRHSGLSDAPWSFNDDIARAMGAPDAETGFSLSYELTLDDIADLVAGSQMLHRRRSSARGQLVLGILGAAAWTAFTVLPNLPSLRVSPAPGWMYAVDAVAWIYFASRCYLVWHLSLRQLARRTWRARQHGRYLTGLNPRGISVIAPDGPSESLPGPLLRASEKAASRSSYSEETAYRERAAKTRLAECRADPVAPRFPG